VFLPYMLPWWIGWAILAQCQRPIGYWPAMAGARCNRTPSIPRAILQCRMSLKKLPEAVAAACLKNEGQLPMRLMFGRRGSLWEDERSGDRAGRLLPIGR